MKASGKPKPPLTSLEWARRVNRTWLVKGHLNDEADAWLEHLSALDDGRLQLACEAAREMCAMREPQCDPKPWFYAGLFCLATADEAWRFLAMHRITRASIPSLEHDEEVNLWMNRVSPETKALIDRLRAALRNIRGHPNS